MGQLFTKSKNQKPNDYSSNNSKEINEKDKAILDLKVARDKLQKYQKKLAVESVAHDRQIRELLKLNKKDRALLVLKIKKMKETEVQKVDNQLLTVLKMVSDIEWGSQSMQVLAALKQGTEALNAIHSEMSVEDIEELLEESKEGIERQNQISELLSNSQRISDDEEAALLLEIETIVNADTTSTNAETNKSAVEIISTSESATEFILPAVPVDPLPEPASAEGYSSSSKDSSSSSRNRQLVAS